MRILIVSLLILAACKKAEKPVSQVIPVTRGEVIRQISIVGRIRSERSVLVRAPIDGQLVKLNKGLGSAVAAGEIIALVEKPRNEESATTIIADEGRLAQLQLDKEQVQVRIEAAKKETSRMQRLLASGSVSSSEFEEAQVAFKQGLKELQSLKNEEKTVRESLKVRKKTKSDTTRELRAPAAGVISQLWTVEENITTGMSIPKDTVVAVIEEPGAYVVKGDITEADYLRLKVGYPVTVALIHGEETKWPGKIKSISPFAREDQMGIGRFEVLISFSPGKTPLKMGLEARSVATLERKNNVLRLPRSAVKQADGKFLVSFPLAKGSGVAPVKPGVIGDQFIEITEGLSENQSIYESYVEAHR